MADIPTEALIAILWLYTFGFVVTCGYMESGDLNVGLSWFLGLTWPVSIPVLMLLGFCWHVVRFLRELGNG